MWRDCQLGATAVRQPSLASGHVPWLPDDAAYIPPTNHKLQGHDTPDVAVKNPLFLPSLAKCLLRKERSPPVSAPCVLSKPQPRLHHDRKQPPGPRRSALARCPARGARMTHAAGKTGSGISSPRCEAGRLSQQQRSGIRHMRWKITAPRNIMEIGRVRICVAAARTRIHFDGS